jgi:acetoin utilization deacetylase AcuC-like enzyme
MTVGYVYHPIYLEHDTGNDPESTQRLVAITDHLQQCGLWAQLHALAATPATPRDIARVHDPALLRRLRAQAESGGGLVDADTVVSPRSYDAALYAAGGAINATRAVLAGEVQSAFALVRPPGHHATHNEAMGFCLLNNIALAASWALAEGGISRLAIVDYDVHHGNGTAEAFADDPNVLFVSLHQYPFYPGTGHWREKGGEAAEGNTLNISLPAYTGDRGYRQAFQRLVEPALRRFQPQLILASAGYDTHWSDPLAWMLVSVSTYHIIATTLARLADELCGGRLVLTLEGGYSLTALAHGAAATFAALLGQPYPDPLGPAQEPERPVQELLQAIARYHGLP